MRALAVVLILVATGSSLTLAQSTQDGTALPTSAEVRKLIDDGKATEAIARLEKLGDQTPELAYLLGVAYYHADDYPHAIERLTAVRGKLTRDTLQWREATQVLGLSLYVTGRYADAIPLLEDTRAWAPGNLELGYVLGQAYIQTRQPDRARVALAQTFAVPPDSAAAHVVNAQMMLRLELEPLAEAELKQALAKDPKTLRANYLLGQLALFRGRLDESIALTSNEVALNPSDAMALSQLGDAYTRASRTDEAIATLQKSMWLNPYYSAPYILLGRLYMKKEQPATAEGMLRRGIEYDPNNRSAHYLLGQLLQQLGRAEEARKEFAIAESLKPAGR
jgi:tetratricopeptide (TPR) repeat protein